MKILICSDGMPAADNAVRIGARLVGPSHADTVLLGIAERRKDEQPLREALEVEAESFRKQGIAIKVAMRAGEPIRQILEETAETKYDLVVIGARRTRKRGLYWRSEKTYEVIKAISPPVLVAMGERM